MIYGIYVIRDIKTSFLTPTIDYNDAAALRNFRMAFSNENSIIGFQPSDFELYKIGTFDNETGNIVSFPKKELICDGVDKNEN